jgi:hypothetical protein
LIATSGCQIHSTYYTFIILHLLVNTQFSNHNLCCIHYQITFSILFCILGLTLDCNNRENGNWSTEISIINDFKNDPKKPSRSNFHHQIHTTCNVERKHSL